MNVLLLCGVTQAGKSTTIRRSVKYLNVDNVIKYKYLHPDEYRNPPKTLKVNGKIVCIFLVSPQETEIEPEDAKKYLIDKIERARKKNADLLVLAFNISQGHDRKTEECLDWITSSSRKSSTYFVYLDSNKYLDNFARQKMTQIENRGYNVLPKIMRTTPDEQGEKFARHIMSLL